MLQEIEQAKIGDIVPVYKEIERIDGIEYFEKLSDYGRSKNCVLFEFNDKIIGSSDPCLKIKGFKDSFEIIALNNKGIKFLALLKADFKFCAKTQYTKSKITGTLKPAKKNCNEHDRLKLKNHMDVIRKVAFKLSPNVKHSLPYSGLFGIFSYDLVENFEDLAEKEVDVEEPYYEFYFLDNLFVSEEDKTYFIANALVFDNKKDKMYDECIKTIKNYEAVLKKKVPKEKSYKLKDQVVSTDTEKTEFEELVRNIKRNILEGNIYRAFATRKIISNYNADTFDIYKNLKEKKPRSYMFYFTSDEGVLFGTSPEMCFKVEGDAEKNIEIGLIAGTNPRGDNKDIQNRYEAEMKIDFKEISKHIMEIDIIRNDIARVSKLGTRHLNKIFDTEKYPEEQSVVSNVKGELKKDFDALHAYVSCMGRLSGCPRIEAMKLLRNFEKNKRGYFFGTICFINPNKDFEGAIIKNAIRMKDKKAYISVNSDVTYDSIPEDEFDETEKKSKIFLEAIKMAGGLK